MCTRSLYRKDECKERPEEMENQGQEMERSVQEFVVWEAQAQEIAGTELAGWRVGCKLFDELRACCVESG